MGCISSKEIKEGTQRISRGTPALSEDILGPRRGSNHFLELVCTATMMKDRPQSGSFMFESPITDTETEDIDAIYIKSDLVPVFNKDQSTGDNVVHSDPPTRSRSWNSIMSEEILHADTGNCSAGDVALEENNKGSIRSRSFHTVVEYDRLLERIWRARLSEKGNTVKESEEKEMLTEVEIINSQETLQPSQDRESLVGESNGGSETVKEGFQGDLSCPDTETNDMKEPSIIENDILGELSIKEEAPQEMPMPLMAKGFKRKSIARRLDVLKIPSTFELPPVASLREWLPVGQVLSPDADRTSELGSYSVPTDNIMNNDELVNALEEQQQHMKAEEAVLKQITSGSTRIKEEISIS